MPKPLSFGHIDVGLTAGSTGVPGVPRSDAPFRILVLGDFSGRANRGLPPEPRIAERRPVRVDRDNFDQVLAQTGVALYLPAVSEDGARLTVSFAELDDFHPDRIFSRVEVFQALRQLRGRLSNAATFPEAAKEVRSWFGGASAAKQEPATPAPEVPSDPSDLLSQMLGEEPGEAPKAAAPTAPEGVDWQAYMRNLVAPYVVPKTDYAQQTQLLTLVDDVTGRQMRALLHHPDFQAVEAAWRALYLLVRRLDTDGNLQLFLLDISKDELAADLSAGDNLAATGTYRLLVEQTVGTQGGKPWAVLAGLYTFGPSRADAELLGRLAKVARQAGAPLLAAGDSRLAGCRSFAATPDPDDWQEPTDTDGREAWEALRGLSEANAVGLAAPRVLLRQPYGKESDPTEQFKFEELPAGSTHEDYLWGNPAIAAVYLLGESYSRYGWDFHPGVLQEVEGLPLHVYEEDGERQLKPCAEAWLSDRAAAALLRRGLMPLLSIQGRDAVLLASFQPLAEAADGLAGRWR